MKKRAFIWMVMYLLGLGTLVMAQSPITVTSPGKLVRVSFSLSGEGAPMYRVFYRNQAVLGQSALGFALRDGLLKKDFSIVGSAIRSTFDETWEPVWGEVKEIRNHYNEVAIPLKHRSGALLKIVFRVYDNGLGFRYEFPKEGYEHDIAITDELTTFQLTGDHKAFWIPGDWDSNEHLYSTTRISEIKNTWYRETETSIGTMNLHDRQSVQTPITFRMANGWHMAIHEAALIDFPAMQLHVDHRTLKFSAMLVPSLDLVNKAVVKPGHQTPWRAILLGDRAADLLSSKLILNLNEPCKYEDTSWIRPMKFAGVWWEMHLGKSTWDYAGTQDAGSAQGLKPTGRHGATTENTKRYIDFAAANNIQGVLVEGWNMGWENWYGQWKDEVFDFAKPYPDYDIKAVTDYARSKGVEIVGHHETSGAVTSYERQMDRAFAYMKQHGIHAVKTGYVGKIIPKGEHHDGQWMVNHYIRAVETAAGHKVMIDAHEPVRPTGLHRTYPNWMASEAARGNEFNAWSRGNPPEHETILPFTRLLGGPMDYTPGIFDVTFDQFKKEERVHTTVAKQLALYVTMYSPVQMVADLPEHYEGHPALEFIREVAVDWDDTRILNAEVGEYLTIARKAKNSPYWFVGSITDEVSRVFTLSLDFLEAGKTYQATVYEDGQDAHWDKNPKPVNIRRLNVKKGHSLTLKLAAGGGAAISLKPAN
ncbi:MAG TPA: glycoside hydrolase family 97 protein [Rhodothermales bacterium]|nr:glycoside hydrolase family 97 protein [Rhodothermales bacterium]HRR09052.1 glycoside hydrolase family 97 protein [Rhodothermales bacterium]